MKEPFHGGHDSCNSLLEAVNRSVTEISSDGAPSYGVQVVINGHRNRLICEIPKIPCISICPERHRVIYLGIEVGVVNVDLIRVDATVSPYSDREFISSVFFLKYVHK